MATILAAAGAAPTAKGAQAWQQQCQPQLVYLWDGLGDGVGTHASCCGNSLVNMRIYAKIFRIVANMLKCSENIANINNILNTVLSLSNYSVRALHPVQPVRELLKSREFV